MTQIKLPESVYQSYKFCPLILKPTWISSSSEDHVHKTDRKNYLVQLFDTKSFVGLVLKRGEIKRKVKSK